MKDLDIKDLQIDAVRTAMLDAMTTIDERDAEINRLKDALELIATDDVLETVDSDAWEGWSNPPRRLFLSPQAFAHWVLHGDDKL